MVFREELSWSNFFFLLSLIQSVTVAVTDGGGTKPRLLRRVWATLGTAFLLITLIAFRFIPSVNG
jgi:hypothetical protein